MHSGRADLSVSGDERHTKGYGCRSNDAIRHVRNVCPSDLVDAVGDARMDRNDLDAWVLGLTYLTNAIRRAGPELVLFFEINNLDDGNCGDEDGEACSDRTVERRSPRG